MKFYNWRCAWAHVCVLAHENNVNALSYEPIESMKPHEKKEKRTQQLNTKFEF